MKNNRNYVREAMAQHEANKRAFTFLCGELAVISIVIGFATKSLFVGIIVFFAGYLISGTPKGSDILSVALGVIALVAGVILFGDIWGILTGLIVLAINMSGCQYVKDLNATGTDADAEETPARGKHEAAHIREQEETKKDD